VGWAIVYKAFDLELNRPVASKLLSLPGYLRPDRQGSGARKARLLREAQPGAALHPNVVTVFDVRHSIRMQSSWPWSISRGKDLEGYLRESTHTSGELLEILIAAVGGLPPRTGRASFTGTSSPQREVIR